MTTTDEERGANREKIKRLVILIVTALVAAGAGRASAPAATGTATVEHHIKLSGQLDCSVKGPIPVKLEHRLEVVPLVKK
jgi:hypothetical protein